MNALFSLSLQRVTNQEPVVYDNQERYRIFRESLPVLLGNTMFRFADQLESVQDAEPALALASH